MLLTLGRFCRDERGSLLLTEWLLLTTILMVAILPPVALRIGGAETKRPTVTGHGSPGAELSRPTASTGSR